MRSNLLSLLIAALMLAQASAEVKISEFMASNDTTLNDQDGNSSDWIELHNDGTIAVDLAGWHITDNAGDLKKWSFPSVVIPAGGYLVVFASGKDLKGVELHTNFTLKKSGEYLAMIRPDKTIEHQFAPSYPPQVQDISYGLSAGEVTTTVVSQGASGQAGVPSTESDYLSNYSEWNTNVAASFTSSSWRNVSSGVGFERNSGYGNWLGMGGDFETEMYNTNSSIFLRIPFNVNDPASVNALILRMRWDAGFIAYINGVQVASDRAPASPVWNSSATSDRQDSQNDDWERFIIDLNSVSLNSGDNLLAIHGLNDRVGSSDMLCLPELDALIPAESSDYLYFTSATPGAVNQAGTTDLAPWVADVTDVVTVLPAGGVGSAPIHVETRVSKTMHDVQSVHLYYRKMFDSESSLTMVDNGTNGDLVSGDGVYTALIPTTGMTAGQMMRWRVVASDTGGNNGHAPAFIDPNDSDQYYGTIASDPSIVTSQLPVLHWFVENTSAANTSGGTRASYYYLGRFYDNIQVDLHGQTTSVFFKKSYDIDFNKGNRFKWKDGEGEVKDINLLTNWADKTKMRNTLAYEMFKNAGAAHHFAFPVRVQQNGAFFSIADMVEDGDDRFLERIGLDGDGALYKMYNSLTGPGIKKTRLYEGSSDIQTLVSSLDENLSQDTRRLYGYDNIDIPATVNYLAGLVLAESQDQGHKNYYVYRDSNGTGEWMPIVWDLDLSLGHNWDRFGSQGYFDDDLTVNDGLQAGAPNRLKTLIWNSPEMNAMFVRRVRTLMDELLQPTSTPLAQRLLESRIDTLADTMDPFGVTSDADLDFTKWGSWMDGGNFDTSDSHRLRAQADRLKNDYLPNRRAFLYSSTPNSNGLAIPTQQTSLPMVTIEDLEYNPSSGIQGGEYFILKNRESEAIDVSGWTISGAVEMTLKSGTVIPAGSGDSASQYIGLLHVTKDSAAFRARSSGPSGGAYRFIQGGYGGQLSARGETIELRDASGNLIDSKSFAGNPTATQEALRVTEINYHPSDPTAGELAALPGVTANDFEWLELMNIGDLTLNLNGATFVDGIDYTFASGVTLSAGQRMILVKNVAAFTLRYGALANVVGPFTGQLSNSGEKLQIKDVSGESILNFSWSDQWYPPSDGLGRTLVIRDPSTPFNAFDEPLSWGIGTSIYGSPGAADPAYYVHFEGWRHDVFSQFERDDTLIGMIDSDPDGDGRSNWAEYCFGTNPRVPDQVDVSQIAANSGGQDYIALEFARRLNAFDIGWSLHSCDDMQSWVEDGSIIHGSPQLIGFDLEKVTLRSNTSIDAGGRRFFRVQGVKQ